MAPDAEGSKYKEIMNRELWRIGRQRAMQKQKMQKDTLPDARYPDEQYNQYRDPSWGVNDWYEISNNPEDFKNKNKPKNGGTDTLAQSDIIDVLIRIANTFDRLGSYRAADQLTTHINSLIHG